MCVKDSYVFDNMFLKEVLLERPIYTDTPSVYGHGSDNR